MGEQQLVNSSLKVTYDTENDKRKSEKKRFYRHQHSLSDTSVLHLNFEASTSDYCSGQRHAATLETVVPDPSPLEHSAKTYLSQQDESCEKNIALQKEDIHFHLSEKLIAAIEQMKWKCLLQNSSLSNQQQCNAQTLNKFGRNRDGNSASLCVSEEDYATSFTTNCSSSSKHSSSLSESSKTSTNTHLTKTSDVTIFNANEHGIPDDTAYLCLQDDSSNTFLSSPLEQIVGLDECNTEKPVSSNATKSGSFDRSADAETIALSLLAKFGHLNVNNSGFNGSNCTEFNWLINESDVPQDLLPMGLPSLPISPDDIVYSRKITQLSDMSNNGVIVKLHPHMKQKKLLAEQKFLCAHCKMKLERVHIKRLQYCEYFGGLMCQCCHRGLKAIVPARVIFRWDFRRFPVSDQAWKHLERQRFTYLYDIKQLNEALYHAVRVLMNMRSLRITLLLVWQYIRCCSLAQEVVTNQGMLKNLFERLPAHFLGDNINLYSMDDLINLKFGRLTMLVIEVVHMARAHIENCAYCEQFAFICELCGNEKHKLFPFYDASKNAARCGLCGACYHLKCLRYADNKCRKCYRIKARQLQIEDNVSMNDANLNLESNISTNSVADNAILMDI